MSWFYNGSNAKSIGDLQSLVNDVILAEGFDPDDLKDFNVSRELKHLGAYATAGPRLSPKDGWKKASIYLHLPSQNPSQTSEATAPKFEVKDVFY